MAIDDGQPIKEVFKVQASATRQKRYEAAEQFAKAASSQATVPLFLVVLASIAILLGPLLIHMFQNPLF